MARARARRSLRNPDAWAATDTAEYLDRLTNANAILVRQAYERYAEGDLAAVLDLIDLDLE